MQVALYMSAVEQLLDQRAVGGFYQPLSGRDLRARGVLARGAGWSWSASRGEIRPPEEVQRWSRSAARLAREAAPQADVGRPKPRPAPARFGDGGCMYPSICRCER